jgi:hypothetical protein
MEVPFYPFENEDCYLDEDPPDPALADETWDDAEPPCRRLPPPFDLPADSDVVFRAGGWP